MNTTHCADCGHKPEEHTDTDEAPCTICDCPSLHYLCEHNYEYMRLDVIVEGALETAENYGEHEIWAEWNEQLHDLETGIPEKFWTLSIYDERPEPPELIKEHVNDPDEDDS